MLRLSTAVEHVQELLDNRKALLARLCVAYDFVDQTGISTSGGRGGGGGKTFERGEPFWDERWEHIARRDGAQARDGLEDDDEENGEWDDDQD